MDDGQAQGSTSLDAPDRSPAGDARRAELRKINDEPGRWNADKESRTAKLFSTTPPPKQNVVHHPNVEIEMGLSAGGSDETPGSPTRDSGAVSPEDAATMTKLKAQEGDNFGAVMADARDGLTAMSRQLGVNAQDLIGSYLEEGGDRVVGIKTLARFGRATRT